MIVELKGGQFVNQGAHLMLIAAREAVLARYPDALLAMRDSRLSSSAARRRFGALRKQPLRRRRLDLSAIAYGLPALCRAAIRRSGVVLEPDVSLILDLSGYAYGDPWGEHSMWAAGDEIRRVVRHGGRYVFLPQAFGPFQAVPAAVQRHFSAGLAQASLVCVRDLRSLANLRKLPDFRDHNVGIFPDFTVSQMPSADRADGSSVDDKTLLVIPNVRVEERLVRSDAESPYLLVLRQVAATARAAGYGVVVLNHSIGEDDELCRRVAAALEAESIVEMADPLANKGLIGSAGLVVSSRYHGCASALSMGVPCLALGWSHKYGELFNDFDMRDWAIDLATLSEAPERLARLMESVPDTRLRLASAKGRLVDRTKVMWGQVFAG
jgi:colanic acid/amylovoran biosynthesis protein